MCVRVSVYMYVCISPRVTCILCVRVCSWYAHATWSRKTVVHKIGVDHKRKVPLSFVFLLDFSIITCDIHTLSSNGSIYVNNHV